jgi:hypothetical protein
LRTQKKMRFDHQKEARKVKTKFKDLKNLLTKKKFELVKKYSHKDLSIILKNKQKKTI